jgi:tetratricopeptide (TPR) repeat protein
MSDTAAKARRLRLERLQSMLDNYLEHPMACLETLMAELKIGELQPDLWEGLHAAAARDGKEAELAAAYRQLAAGPRSKQLPPVEHAELMMQAANFLQGVVGDAEGAAAFLQMVLEVVPNHAEAFARLERRLEAAGDKARLVELYATVAKKPPKPAEELARIALNAIVLLPAKNPISDEACKRLISFAQTSPGILDVVETHCLKTGRAALACVVREHAVDKIALPPAVVAQQRQRLIELYLGDVNTPEKAIAHVEALLERDPNDTQAKAAADRLLRVREVASRAAAALKEARNKARSKE